MPQPLYEAIGESTTFPRSKHIVKSEKPYAVPPQPQEPVTTPALSSSKPEDAKQASFSKSHSPNFDSGAQDHATTASSSWNKEAVDFKQDLLAKLNNEHKLYAYLEGIKVDKGIVILQNGHTTYTILNADNLLEHPRIDIHFEESSYVQIEYRPQDSSQGDITSTKKLHGRRRFCADLPKQSCASKLEGDFFLPLGWFVEGRSGIKRATRYVCMLNVSTKPLSIWLMFDYLLKDEDNNGIDLSDLTFIYDERIYGDKVGWDTLTDAKRLIKHKDLLLIYQNVADWNSTSKNSGAAAKLPKEYSYYLGSSVEAVNAIPSRSLLDAVTTSTEPTL